MRFTVHHLFYDVEYGPKKRKRKPIKPSDLNVSNVLPSMDGDILNRETREVKKYLRNRLDTLRREGKI